MKRSIRIILSRNVFISVYLFGVLFSAGGWASPAGVIPYACHDNRVLILLAYDLAPGREGYAAFGGGAKPGETVAETAAREFYEETHCAFDQPDSNALSLLTPSNSNGFYSYVTKIKYLEPLSIELKPCDADLERAGWQWFELNQLRRALTTNSLRPAVSVFQSDQVVRLWDLGAQSLRQAEQDGLLSADVLCR